MGFRYLEVQSPGLVGLGVLARSPNVMLSRNRTFMLEHTRVKMSLVVDQPVEGSVLPYRYPLSEKGLFWTPVGTSLKQVDTGTGVLEPKRVVVMTWPKRWF